MHRDQSRSRHVDEYGQGALGAGQGASRALRRRGAGAARTACPAHRSARCRRGRTATWAWCARRDRRRASRAACPRTRSARDTACAPSRTGRGGVGEGNKRQCQRRKHKSRRAEQMCVWAYGCGGGGFSVRGQRGRPAHPYFSRMRLCAFAMATLQQSCASSDRWAQQCPSEAQHVPSSDSTTFSRYAEASRSYGLHSGWGGGALLSSSDTRGDIVRGRAAGTRASRREGGHALAKRRAGGSATAACCSKPPSVGALASYGEGDLALGRLAQVLALLERKILRLQRRNEGAVGECLSQRQPIRRRVDAA